MSDIALITGGGSGIGRALAHRLAERYQMDVYIVGRRPEKLQQTAAPFPERIFAIPADVSTEERRASIAAALKNRKIRFLVHNAGVLDPVKPLLEVTVQEWRNHMAVNVEGALFLTQKLVPLLEKGARILHISSGAAHNAYAGWGAYCASKAALHMIYQVFREELKAYGIIVGSLRPGVVDTPMQDHVREAAPEIFPALEKFLNLKKEGKLFSPETVAKFIAYLLFQTSEAQFSVQEWDIRDHLELLQSLS